MLPRHHPCLYVDALLSSACIIIIVNEKTSFKLHNHSHSTIPSKR
jgi:hypothetical protein